MADDISMNREEIEAVLNQYGFELSYDFLSKSCRIPDDVLSLLCA